MSKKKVAIIAAGVIAAIGAVAAVSAQGHRPWRDGPMHFGRGDGPGMGPGGAFGGRFAGPVTKEDHEAQTRERFARLDRNSDGVIDAGEIESSISGRMEAMRSRFGGQGPRMAERMLRYFDTNKDGKVTREEYQAGVKKMFAEMDLNNDGRLSDDDLPPLMRGRNALGSGGGGGRAAGPGGMMGSFAGGPLMRLLREADANNDGVVTLEEANSAADKRFAVFDRNKDGAIDKADFDALRKEMVDYRVRRFIHHHGADKDGKVTREQFAAKARERFARMDLNDDGSISRDEMPGRGRGFRHRIWHGRDGAEQLAPDDPGRDDASPDGRGVGPGGRGPRRGPGNN